MNRSFKVSALSVVLGFVLVAVLLIAWISGAFSENITADVKLDWDEYYDLGSSLALQDRYEEAATAFKIAMAIDSLRPEAYIGAAECYIAMENLPRAKEILESGLEYTGNGLINEMLCQIPD